MTAGIKR